ncbi:hypothetical protein RHMOL_Rhmol03G0066600 [Rhododendron molle]|uniref:Uncharacterized protein n=1 Tax=Rhododendron molle TaxID=49168 RepID=A0ACC0PBG0_RHOML|nr:hypothetical protein RHMOL_Rhmol03G0066600 [Rhododendron molle]
MKIPRCNFSNTFNKIEQKVILYDRNASKTLDFGARLGIKLVGGRNFNLKKLVEMEEEEIANRENALKKYAELEEGEFSDWENNASISLEF